MPDDVSAAQAYEELFGFKPNPMQREMFERVASVDCAVLLKAPTGSGKTEAVLAPALSSRLFGGDPTRLFLILPTRSLVEDQVERVERVLSGLSQKTGHALSMVVDTGEQSYRKVWHRGQATEARFRHLYDGDVVITTLDKFLYRFFGFGEPYKSYIFPFRIRFGAKKPLFCFDEAHTYEGTAFTNFVNLVYTLAVKAGRNVVVMTATMPQSYAKRIDFLDVLDYTEGEDGRALSSFYQRPHEGKCLEYVECSSDELVKKLVQQALTHCKKAKQRVIVTAELVEDAVAVYRQLRKSPEKNPTLPVYLYHGRLPDQVSGEPAKGRRPVYHELKQHEQRNEGYLLVTTSAIEVGCDLNAHVLVTELCNPDQLVQRAGRCNRRGRIEGAKVVVVGDRIKPFLSDLDREAQQTYVEALRALKTFDPQAILKHLSVQPQTDYRAQMLFDMLYEYVHEANQVYRGLHEKGLVITRSWEPALTLCTGFDDEGHPLNPVSVSMRSLIAWPGEELTSGCTLYRRYYDGDRSRQTAIEPLTRGYFCAYFVDLYLHVPADFFDSDAGYSRVPKVFQRQNADGYKEVVKSVVSPGTVQSQKKRGRGASQRADEAVWFWYLRDAQSDVSSQGEQEDEEESED